MISKLIPILPILTAILLVGCTVERRKSDVELGLNAQEARGRAVFDQHCDRCHEAYSSGGKKGPSLKGMYKKQFLPSGMPANDQRVSDVIIMGRAKMPAFNNAINDRQLQDLLAYLKTL